MCIFSSVTLDSIVIHNVLMSGQLNHKRHTLQVLITGDIFSVLFFFPSVFFLIQFYQWCRCTMWDKRLLLAATIAARMPALHEETHPSIPAYLIIPGSVDPLPQNIRPMLRSYRAEHTLSEKFNVNNLKPGWATNVQWTEQRAKSQVLLLYTLREGWGWVICECDYDCKWCKNIHFTQNAKDERQNGFQSKNQLEDYVGIELCFLLGFDLKTKQVCLRREEKKKEEISLSHTK